MPWIIYSAVRIDHDVIISMFASMFQNLGITPLHGLILTVCELENLYNYQNWPCSFKFYFMLQYFRVSYRILANEQFIRLFYSETRPRSRKISLLKPKHTASGIHPFLFGFRYLQPWLLTSAVTLPCYEKLTTYFRIFLQCISNLHPNIIGYVQVNSILF